MTPEQQHDYLEKINPYCLIIGFRNGKFDAAVCLLETDLKNEKRKFSVYKIFEIKK